MIRHTGGLAFGATSTRSRSCSRATCNASGNGRTPSLVPSWSTRNTSRARILSLILGSLLTGGTAMRHHSLGWPAPTRRRAGVGKQRPPVGGHPTRRTLVLRVAQWPGGGPEAPLSLFGCAPRLQQCLRSGHLGANGRSGG